MKRRDMLRLSLLAGAGVAVPAAGASGESCARDETDGTPAQFLPKAAPDPAPLTGELDKYPICPYCGMDRRYFHKSRMLIHYGGDRPDPLCSIHCAVISLALNLSLDPRAIHVADNASDIDPRPLIDAERATFLVGSDIPGVMTAKSKVAYGSVQAATAAQQRHGGELMDFPRALQVAFADLGEDMARMRKAREERRKRAAKRNAG
jgi:nitrous oxide reductase accessory protein NosL